MSDKPKTDFKTLLSSDKARRIFIIIALCAIGLIFLSSRFDSKTEDSVAKNFDTQSYKTILTSEVLAMVENIEGAGKAKVMLTLDSSYEYIYLDDDKTLKKVNEPVVRGVVIACEGGGSTIVSAKITELIGTALGIPSNKVCVTKLT